jgi:hypothetical protein
MRKTGQHRLESGASFEINRYARAKGRTRRLLCLSAVLLGLSFGPKGWATR